MLSQKYRSVEYLIAGAVVILVIILIASHKPATQTSVPSQPTTANETTPVNPTAPASESAPSSPPSSVPTTTTAPKKPAPAYAGYEAALKTYAGKRIQFDSCHGTPGELVLTKGAKFMLDNRDNKTHAIAVGAARFSVKAYGYAIASANIVGTVNITCDGGGAASLNVQP